MVSANTEPSPPRPPVSGRKLSANRANAGKSTGPRTEAGKRASSLNATTHGLTAQTAVLPGEDPAALAELAGEMREALRPARGVESVLVERVIALEWKLRRVAAAEPEMIEELESKNRRGWRRAREMARMFPGRASPSDVAPVRSAAEILAAEMVERESPIQRLAAYEARLTSQLLGTCRQLERLQKARAGRQEADDPEEDQDCRRVRGMDGLNRDTGLQPVPLAAETTGCKPVSQPAQASPQNGTAAVTKAPRDARQREHPAVQNEPTAADTGASGEDLAHDPPVDVGQPEVPAGVAVGELLVVEPEQVKDGGV